MSDLEIYQLTWKILKKYSWMQKKKKKKFYEPIPFLNKVYMCTRVCVCVCVCELLYEHKNIEKYKLGC